MRDHYEAFPKATFLKSLQVNVELRDGKPASTTPNEFFDLVKAYSEEGSECIQVGRDVLVFNQLNRKSEWPGYEAMTDTAIKAANQYMGFRGFNELVNVSLHYRDIVSIPRPSDEEGIRLREWFRVYPEVPEDTLGTMSAFRFDVQLAELCQDADARLSIRSLPPVGQEKTDFRFWIDWHVTSTDNRIREIEAARNWLDAAHEALRSSFKKAFTPQCLELFGPEKETEDVLPNPGC